jgi:NAD(P)-dependent dehydrogenase (short-subunit alcohol dehydrogenase family)
MGLLDGETAIITGAASGMGRATARRMTEEGATVAVFDLDADGAQKVADEIGGYGYGVDVGDADAMQAAVDAAVQRLGGLSIIYNNAGTAAFALTHEIAPADWERVVRVNLLGPYHGIRAAVPYMIEAGRGNIVSTASISGVRPAAGESPYAASKAAVIALTASAALEYGPMGIRVNCVSPGTIHTGMTDPLLSFTEGRDFMRDKTPLGRIGDPEDIADTVVFLCSNAARYITGHNLVVDGGVTLHGSGVDGLLGVATQLKTPV